MKKNIVFFSNPFGFGLTSKAIALINAGLKYWDANLYYVANADCMPIFEDKNVQIISADQRNPNEIKEILSRFSNAYVVSSLNRFAVKIANELKISLFWLILQ